MTEFQPQTECAEYQAPDRIDLLLGVETAVGKRRTQISMTSYTLRLLTLDQLARADGLGCALELEREKNERATASGTS